MTRRVTVDDTTGKGVYAADGSFRVTVVTGSTYVGLYAADGSYNVVIVEANDTPYGVYHASGALRGVVADGTENRLFAPNGALYLYGLTGSSSIVWRATGHLFGASQPSSASAAPPHATDDLLIILLL